MELDYTVLVVDDIEKNLQLIGNLLKDKGISITMATNGKQAIKAAQKKKPDLILLDIMMPEMDGYEVCYKLKSDKKTESIPVIFLTAKNETEDIVKGFAVGGVDFVKKPFKKEELISRVFTHLELKRSRDIINDQKSQLEIKNASILQYANRIEELNGELQSKNNTLEELVNTKDKFFSIIAHDLKSPLHNLILMTEIVLDKISSSEKKEIIEYMEGIRDSVNSSNKLLENLLQWSRAQTGRITYHPRKIDLRYIINTVFQLHKKTAENKNITMNICDCENWNVFVDESMINTVIRNLVSNAIKFTQKEGRIEVSCTEKKEGDADMIEVTIADNGMGMDGKLVKNLFRIDKKNVNMDTEGEKGTGLGLILCKEFVEMNKGKIYVESKPGEGSKFKFLIPAFTG